jgi:uncharacterized tellurite resistance protein B-like protein
MMIKLIKKILAGSKNDENLSSSSSNKKKLEIAACTLLVEIGKADSNFTKEERKKIISIMKETFDLAEDHIQELIELSEKRLKVDDSIYEFTTIINENFSNEEKFELLKNLWRLIYTDDDLNKYEEHLVKKIGTLLNIEYTNIISAKLIIKEELRK